MLNAPIGEAANIFIWGVCIVAGVVAAIVTLDNLKPGKKEKKAS
jgi:hypothetical protein